MSRTSLGTTQKHRNFVSEPMGEKSIRELPGVGAILGARLEAKGYDKAYTVLAQFLLFKKNAILFQQWMGSVCNANSKQASDCYLGLKEWCDQFL